MGASQYYGKPHFVWSGISTGLPSFRYDLQNIYFDDVSPAVIFASKEQWCLLGLLNSKVVIQILTLIAPTIHFQAGDIKVIPVKKEVENIDSKAIIENIDLSKSDWDSFETSWDFTVHPLVKNHVGTVSEAYTLWKNECEDRFVQLKSNEEELNRIFIDIYGLQDELTPEVEDKDIWSSY